jgi:hypothetical protein
MHYASNNNAQQDGQPAALLAARHAPKTRKCYQMYCTTGDLHVQTTRLVDAPHAARVAS